MNERTKRQSFLGEQSDTILGKLRVAIVGLGGGGSHIVQQLAHIGVGHFVLFDHDRIEESNLNRLVGGTLADVENKEWKVNIGSRVIRSVNLQAEVIAESRRWQERAELLRDRDVVFGCVDSFAARDELERAARRYLIPYIDIGMDIHERGSRYYITGQVALSLPGEACLHCMNILRPDLLAQEAAQYGAAGGRPQVVWPNGILASLAVGIMMQLVTPWHDNHQSVVLLEYDGNVPVVRSSTSISYLRGKSCAHFAAPSDLGDPWYAQNPRIG
jgi:molybdopterin-synthase adenylyltransferase